MSYLPRSWDKFNRNDLIYCLSLQAKLEKHADNNDGQRCIVYIRILWEHFERDDFYPDKDGCIPCAISKDVVNKALSVARQYRDSQVK